MDARFILLVLAACALAFAGTWMISGDERGPAASFQSSAAADAPAAAGAPASCEEAEKRGLAPIMAGQPGYSRKLDPDNDGVACPPR